MCPNLCLTIPRRIVAWWGRRCSGHRSHEVLKCVLYTTHSLAGVGIAQVVCGREALQARILGYSLLSTTDAIVSSFISSARFNAHLQPRGTRRG
jgi:hypothetical protein